MLIKDAYIEQAGRPDFVKDPEQVRVVDAMQRLQKRIASDVSPLRRILRVLDLRAEPERTRGVYLWGGVGRGKTFLMDLFFNTLPIQRKRRVHFHRMMSEVHARLGELRDVEDPLDTVAAAIAKETEVLCFDEFFVSDIGDAMILGRLLQGLFRRGVILVTTSNLAPPDLYANGLQRERFLPAIRLLERQNEVLHLEGETDYRLRLLEEAGTFLCPAGDDADRKLHRYFQGIGSGAFADDTGIQVLGRSIPARKSAKGIAWFTFEALCEGPRSQQDYIEIARCYPTVIISGVPLLDAGRENAARRFIALVDEFYDRRVKLILSAAGPISALYAGSLLKFEFERTVSRITEMQTGKYLHSEHLS
ncbi:MAG TPA: cell division protein ZapE [Woeseiaceae bacterium]